MRCLTSFSTQWVKLALVLPHRQHQAEVGEVQASGDQGQIRPVTADPPIQMRTGTGTYPYPVP
ncbi:hypothetical protein ACWGCW_12855 [Streptomyces sp. NPDC054933]